MKWKIAFIIIGILTLVIGGLALMSKGELSLVKLEKSSENGIISASEIEITGVDYKNNNMTIEFKNGINLIGKATLLSHETYNGVKEIESGKDNVIIWYNLSDFTNNISNGLGEVRFIDMRKFIANNSIRGDEKGMNRNNFMMLNPNYNKSYRKNYTFVYLDEKGEWLKYNTLEIPKDNIIIGVKTNLKWGEFTDVQLNILNKTLDRHALVRGTNFGLVTTAPSADPDASTPQWTVESEADAINVTSPEGATQIIEIGWWCDTAVQESNFEVGVYDHNVGDNNPENLLAGADHTNAKGTTAGWKSVTGLNISITENTKYWIAFQADDTLTNTAIDYSYQSGTATHIISAATLPDVWGTSIYSNNGLAMAIYAIWDTGGGDTQCWVYDSGSKMLSLPEGCVYQSGSAGI